MIAFCCDSLFVPLILGTICSRCQLLLRSFHFFLFSVFFIILMNLNTLSSFQCRDKNDGRLKIALFYGRICKIDELVVHYYKEYHISGIFLYSILHELTFFLLFEHVFLSCRFKSLDDYFVCVLTVKTKPFPHYPR